MGKDENITGCVSCDCIFKIIIRWAEKEDSYIFR